MWGTNGTQLCRLDALHNFIPRTVYTGSLDRAVLVMRTAAGVIGHLDRSAPDTAAGMFGSRLRRLGLRFPKLMYVLPQLFGGLSRNALYSIWMMANFASPAIPMCDSGHSSNRSAVSFGMARRSRLSPFLFSAREILPHTR